MQKQVEFQEECETFFTRWDYLSSRVDRWQIVALPLFVLRWFVSKLMRREMDGWIDRLFVFFFFLKNKRNEESKRVNTLSAYRRQFFFEIPLCFCVRSTRTRDEEDRHRACRGSARSCSTRTTNASYFRSWQCTLLDVSAWKKHRAARSNG